MKFRILVVAFLTAVGLVVAPVTTVGHSQSGAPTTVLGQEADTASARGPVTLYCASPAPIRRYTSPNWYRMDPCTSYYADAIKPYIGWGMTYYVVGQGRYTVRCTSAPYGCPSVLVPPDGVQVVGVFHL